MCSRSGIKRLPGKLLLLCVLVLVVGVTSCATDKDMNYLNDQVIALNRRVAKLEEGTDNRLSTIRTSQGDVRVDPIRNRGLRVGRNDPCPCGSGKKYKVCCMRKGG